MKITLLRSLGLSTRFKSLVCLLGLVVTVSTTEAQVSYTSGSYTQTFDGLPASGSSSGWADNTTLTGWYAWMSLASSPSSPTTISVDNGSITGTTVLHSLGATGSSDRALGTLPGTSSGTWLTGVRLHNSSTTTYTSFTFSFDGEQWRAASTTSRELSTEWVIGSFANLGAANVAWKAVDDTKFVSPKLSGAATALNGNDPECRIGLITGTVNNVNWVPGSDLWIRFTNAQKDNGNMGLAIDNFAFSAGTVETDPLIGFRGEAINVVNAVNSGLATPSGDLELRLLPLAAYVSLVLNYPDATTAENNARKYIDAMLTKQDKNASDTSFGQFFWNYGGVAPTDPNATEFCLRPLAVILESYKDRLGVNYVNTIKQDVLYALAASRNHSVPPNYTNIYTMRALNLIMLGEALGDSSSFDAGRTALGTWRDDVAREGMHEYDSPTYSVVTYSNLLLGAHNIKDVVLADTFRSMATFLAVDLAANYFDGQGRLSGSHSRDYDFMTGGDAVHQVYYLEGLRKKLPNFYAGNEGIIPYLDRLENNLVELKDSSCSFPADALAWSKSWLPRVIKSRWGPTASVGQDRYNFITSQFSIGSSGTYYGLPQDKAVSADLTSASSLAQFSLVYDPYDAPYGKKQDTDGVGFLKPNHLQFFGANVQEKGSILSLANLSPNFATSANFLGPYDSISTSFVFPTQVDALYIDGAVVSRTAGMSYPVSSDTVVGVVIGKTVIAARFLVVDGMRGYTPTYAVKLDVPSGPPAGRFVAYHYKPNNYKQPFTSDDKPRVAVLISARTWAEDADIGKFLKALKTTQPTIVNGSTWSVSMLVDGVTLKAAQDLSSGAIAERKVDGKDYLPATPPTMFTINDGGSTTRDIFAERFASMIGSGWVRCDIGSVAAVSKASYDTSAKTTTVTASGADFSGVADSGAFTYRTVTGDCVFTARVDSQENSNGWAKAGVMIRETLDANSKGAFACVTPSNGAQFSYRATTGGASSPTPFAGVKAPYWVRIIRKGNSIGGYVRSEGGVWQPVGTPKTIDMNATVYIGLPAASCNNAATSKVVFSNVSVQ